MRARLLFLLASLGLTGCPIGDLVGGDAGNLDARPPNDQGADTIANACPSQGGAMVNLGTYCIDETEVTASAYAAFLATQPDPVKNPDPYCVSMATSYTPQTWSNGAEGEKPVTFVSWCDANGFCAWAGKRLCQGKYHDLVTSSEWYAACTNGKTTPVPYGNAPVSGVCNVDSTSVDGGAPGLAPVRSFKACHGQGRYAAVFDQVGNAREWQGACSGSFCDLVGGAYPLSGVTCDGDLVSPATKTDKSDGTAGFRCCADPR